VADGFHRQRAAHEQSDVEGLGDFRLAGALVEDLLDPMIDSVEAVLRHRHRQSRQLLVLLG
jgi:hypothetical protein